MKRLGIEALTEVVLAGAQLDDVQIVHGSGQYRFAGHMKCLLDLGGQDWPACTHPLSHHRVWRAEIHHVPGSGDCHRGIRLRVWGGAKTSQALQADLLSVAWPAPWGACATDGAYPTPADIRAVIGYALQHGWQPERRGGTFVLSEREHATRFHLPGFLLTDRLCTPQSADPTARVIHAHELRHQS